MECERSIYAVVAEMVMMMDSGPPLWVWALIIGSIIAAKLALRWSRLRRLARLLRRN